jgi:hypothetical protein
MSTPVAPGVYVETVPPPAQLLPCAVDVAAIIGVFERGPLDTPTRVASWPQVQATFGDFIANGIGAYAMKGWLDNGGRVAYVVRVAAPARTTTSTGVQPADRQASIVGDLTGLVAGAGAAIEQGDVCWLELVTAVDPLTNTVSWGAQLPPELDLTTPFTVTTGASAAGTSVQDASAARVLEISASSPGAWGNQLTVEIESRTPAATASVPAAAPVASETSVATVDGFTPATLVAITQGSGGAVKTEHRIVTTVVAAPPTLVWDADLATIDPTQPMRIEAQTFALSVRCGGVLMEVHDGLTTVPQSPGFAPAALPGTSLISCAVPAGTLPPPVTGNPVSTGWLALTAGLDGTAALSTEDILGDEAVGLLRGLAALTATDEPAIVCIPDLVGEYVAATVFVPPPPQTVDPCVPCQPPPAPPALLVQSIFEASASFTPDQIAAVQQALIDDCESRADRIAALDPPCGPGPLDVPATISWRGRFDSSYAALYSPWITVLDPLAVTPGQPPLPWGTMRRLPPSAHLAGVMAATDAAVGPWQAPANQQLQWVHACDLVLDDRGHGMLNAAGVCALRPRSGRGIWVLGARMISSDPLWLYLSTRRLMLMLERTFRVGLAWTVFEPAGSTLQKQLMSSIYGLLLDLYEQGAFGGSSAAEAFGVGYDGSGEELVVVVNVGVQPKPPAEVIVLQVMRTENQLMIRQPPITGAPQ